MFRYLAGDLLDYTFRGIVHETRGSNLPGEGSSRQNFLIRLDLRPFRLSRYLTLPVSGGLLNPALSFATFLTGALTKA